MEFYTLASSSAGNAALVCHNDTHLLIDAGISCRRITQSLAALALTLEDIDTYSMISRRIVHEDLFTIVDTYFMPYGMECDKYSILGEILEVEMRKNEVTEEEICVMKLSCNELVFDVCINQKDLLGEPMPGRRFKGTIWLQGKINFL